MSKSKSGSVSVAGSNIFFNNKNSLGCPIRSNAGAGKTCAGRVVAPMAACPMAC
uniref:RNA-binding protein 39-like isoform X2 n=1 Tax=Rhizophora mucronata TaxID=61149 RepID=A0A2P2LEM8_RHIMU